MDDYSGGYDWSDIKDWRNNNHSRKGEIVDKDYKILSVTAREAFDGQYGTMQPYDLKLEGVEGTVQLTQKPETPAPQQGTVIHGHTYTQGNFTKFKRVNPEYSGGHRNQAPQQSDGYVVILLEAIAKAVGAESAVKGSVSDEDEIDLSDIPF